MSPTAPAAAAAACVRRGQGGTSLIRGRRIHWQDTLSDRHGDGCGNAGDGGMRPVRQVACPKISGQTGGTQEMRGMARARDSEI
jgi:hypothetical protein